MATKNWNDLDELTTAVDADELLIEDTTANLPKKITKVNLLKEVVALITGILSGTTTFAGLKTFSSILTASAGLNVTGDITSAGLNVTGDIASAGLNVTGDITSAGSIGASISSTTDTGAVTTNHLFQVNASYDSTASGDMSQVNASTNSTASGVESQVNASYDSDASEYRSQVNASSNSTASGDMSQVNASSLSTASASSSQVNASYDSTASEYMSQVNASSNSTASGDSSQVNASTNSTASGDMSQVNASYDSTASGYSSQVNASDNSTASGYNSQVNASYDSTASGENSQVNASNRTINGTEYSTAWGYKNTGVASKGNQTIRLESNGGRIRAKISTIQGFDFAEFFESKSGKAIDTGTIVMLDGEKIVPANGDDFLGVISETAGYIGNAEDFCWKGRYLRNEFGGFIWEEIPDMDYKLKEGETEKDRPTIRVKKENPDYDSSIEYVSREDRQEWNVVGLLGQVFVRTSEKVQVGDFLKAVEGMGVKSDTQTRIQVMKITKEYDDNYGIVFCLLR